MAGGAVAALTGVLGGIGSALTNQSRSPVAEQARHQDTSTTAIAMAGSTKARKAALKNADKERMMALLTDPQVMGLLVTFGGLFAAQVIPWSENERRRTALAALASSSAVLMGLGRAGVGDLTSLMVAAGAGGAVAATGEGAVDWSGMSGAVGGDRWPATLYLGGYPVASAFGPMPGIQKLLQGVA